MSATAQLQWLTARWRRRRAAAGLAAALAVALPAAALAWSLPLPLLPRAALAAGALLLAAAVAAWRVRPRPDDRAALAAHLDRRLPALAESSGLLLAPPALLALQELQRRRVERALAAQPAEALVALLPRRPLRRALLAAALGLVAAAAVLALRSQAAALADRPVAAPGGARRASAAVPLLRSLSLSIQPPAYTGRSPRRSDAVAAPAEEGATLTWRVETRAAVTQAWLLLDEERRLPLAATGAGSFTARRTVREPHLVRLVLAGRGQELWRSPPARLEVIPDRPPTVELLAPATLVERPVDRPGTLTLELLVGDDYGVRHGTLQVTLATGSDEQVQFRDLMVPLDLRPSAARQRVRHRVDLESLGLAAGSEVYLRAEVRDGRQPRPNLTRAPAVVVRLPIERAESAPLAAGIPALVAPEVLRSQRQIVVDTERLLAEAPRLSAAEIARRSRGLALDQRAVRTRYGVLLGDETVDGRAVEADPEHEGAADGPHAAIAAIPEAAAHQHDSSEANTYFPDPVRRRLRAMLAAMWEAEEELAVDAPRAALPHERRALALLKEVQQAARVYVRRTGGESTPLDPSRRLGGELEGVHDLSARRPGPTPSPETSAARAALAALARGPAAARADGAPPLDGKGLAALRVALTERARAGDATALAALPLLDSLAGGSSLAPAEREALSRALWELLPEPLVPPRRTAPSATLWERYQRALGTTPPAAEPPVVPQGDG